MAITTSAKKAYRQSLRKKEMNETNKRAVRTATKAVRTATSNDAKVLAEAYKAIDKAAKRGIIKKNTAAHKKAAVSKALKAKAK